MKKRYIIFFFVSLFFFLRQPVPAGAAPSLALLYRQGMAALRQKQWQKAVVRFTALLRQQKDHLKALNNRGVARLGLKQFASARADFQRYLKINPKPALVWNNLGVACLKRKKYPAALRAFQTALTKKPTRAKYAFNQALAHFYLGQYDEAAKLIRRAHRLDERYTKARLQKNRGRIEAFRKKHGNHPPKK